MKWIGQHIHDFIARFRSDVYLEGLDTSTETNILVVDSAGKITKNAGAGDDTSFTVAATTTGTGTTITDGDSLTIAAGTGITTTGTSDGVVTIANTVTDTNTMGTGFTVSATTDSNATTITQGDDLMFTAGTGITCETTADGTVTIANTVTNTNTNQLTTFRVAADSGSDQTIAHGNTLTIAGGNGISTTTTATDQANVIIDTAQTTITSVLPGQQLTVGWGADEGTSFVFQETSILLSIAGDTLCTFGVNLWAPLHDTIHLGDTDHRFVTGWFSESVNAPALVAETSLSLDSVVIGTVQTAAETFADNDTSVMTSAAINDLITAQVSANNVVFMNHHAFVADSDMGGDDWVFPHDTRGVEYYNYTDVSDAVANDSTNVTFTLPRQSQHKGIIVPYACTLRGIYGSMQASSNHRGALSLWVYTPAWGVGGSSGVTATRRFYAIADLAGGSSVYTSRPTKIYALDGSSANVDAPIALSAGDAILPALVCPVDGETTDLKCSFTIVLKVNHI